MNSEDFIKELEKTIVELRMKYILMSPQEQEKVQQVLTPTANSLSLNYIFNGNLNRNNNPK